MPPAVALLNYMRSGTCRRFFPQGWNFSRGFLHKLLILLEGSAKLPWARRRRAASYFNKPEKTRACSAAKHIDFLERKKFLFISPKSICLLQHIFVYSCTCYCLKAVGEWGGGEGGGGAGAELRVLIEATFIPRQAAWSP